MIHSAYAAFSDAARRRFARVTAPKQLLWAGATQHFQFYDDPAVLDRGAAEITRWLTDHLG